MGRRKRRGPTEPGLKIGEPSIPPDKRDVRMSADDQGGPLSRSKPGNVRVQLGAVDGDVNEQDPQQQPGVRHDVQRQRIGKRIGMGIDVPTNGQYGGHGRERVEYAGVTDIPRVDDGVGEPCREELQGRGVRRGMAVRDDGEAQ